MTSMTFTHPLKPGLYVLREKFVSTKVDRRLSSPGFGTPIGFPKGTTFKLAAASHRGERSYTLKATFVRGAYNHEVFGYIQGDNEDISWGAPVGVPDLKDVERLFNLLDPDNTDESFVDDMVDRNYYSEGNAAEVLVMLLKDGVITRDMVKSYAKAST